MFASSSSRMTRLEGRKMPYLLLLSLIGGVVPALAQEGNRTTLTYGVLNFDFPPWLTYEDGKPAGGFFYDFLMMFGRSMNVTIVPVPLPDFFTSLDTTAFMSDYIRDGTIDVGWSQTPDFDRTVAEGMSYAGAWAYGEFVCMGKKTTLDREGYMQFLLPFSSDLWYAILGSILVGAVVAMFLLMNNMTSDDGKKKKKTIKRLARTTFRSVYHVFAAVLGAESPDFEYEMVSASFLGKVFRLGLLFLVLMIGATYTANLASCFIRAGTEYHGPQNLAELKESKVCILNTITTATVLPFVGKAVPNPLTVEQQANQTLNEAWTHEALINGDCDAIVRPRAYNYATPGLECDRMYVIPGLTFSPFQYYQFMSGETPEDRRYARKAAGHMARILQTREYQEAYNKAFQPVGQCGTTDSADADGLFVIQLENFVGVFMIYGSVCAFVIAGSLFQFLNTARKKNAKKTKEDQTETALQHETEETLQDETGRGWEEGEGEFRTTIDELILLVSKLEKSRAARRDRDFQYS